MTGLTTNSASAGHGFEETPARALAASVEGEFSPEIPQDLAPAPQPDPEAWRQEVAARLARYRTRRKPRAPRYPSLLLPFESRDDWSRPVTSTTSTRSAESNRIDNVDKRQLEHQVLDHQVEDHQDEAQTQRQFAKIPNFDPEPSAKVIEFPRSAAIPIIYPTPLADPIFDRPRIVEAPEIVPPAPALGGILIEPAQPDPAERSAAAEARILSASIARRLLAASMDGLIIAVTLCVFFAIFLRFNPIRGPLALIAGVAGVLAVSLWVIYQFAFIVGTGSTPGLRTAGLVLTKFDGSPVPRRTRRWRVLASFLSAFSAGLGYLWCLLDQDSLCWHDRITRTLVQPARSTAQQGASR